jgi:hypothetical protein
MGVGDAIDGRGGWTVGDRGRGQLGGAAAVHALLSVTHCRCSLCMPVVTLPKVPIPVVAHLT